MIETERMTVTGLGIAHAQMAITAAANGVKPHRIPKLAEFVPDTEPAEPKKPLDARGWADALMAAFAG